MTWTVRSTKSWPAPWSTVTPFETEEEALVAYDERAEHIRRDGGCVEMLNDGRRQAVTMKRKT